MATGRLDADAPHIFQTFDRAGHCGGPGGVRQLSQLSWSVLGGAVAAVRECVDLRHASGLNQRLLPGLRLSISMCGF
jgi:hypothetical protein